MRATSLRLVGFALLGSVLCAASPAPETGKARAVEFDDLDCGMTCGSFDRSRIPQRVRDLNGKQVQIRGFMYPPATETGITMFFLDGESKSKPLLSVDSGNPNIPAHHLFIEVHLRSGTTTTSAAYQYDKPLLVSGRLVIEETVFDGQLYGLFVIKDAKVTLVAPRSRPAYYRLVRRGC